MIDVIMPCYLLPDRGRELTDFFLTTVNSLHKCTQEELRLIVVDNGSVVDDYVLRDYADLYVRNKKNLGYGPAVNQGLRLATAPIIMVINNDLGFHYCDWPAKAKQHLAQPDVGIVSSHLIDHDPSMQAYEGLYDFSHMFGACWAITDKTLAQVGLLDEQFLIGMYEDRDYAQRIKAAGFNHCKAGWVSHVGNATWGKMPNQQQIFMENRQKYNKKWKVKDD